MSRKLYVSENITMDRSSATGQFMFHLFASFAEFERNFICRAYVKFVILIS